MFVVTVYIIYAAFRSWLVYQRPLFRPYNQIDVRMLISVRPPVDFKGSAVITEPCGKLTLHQLHAFATILQAIKLSLFIELSILMHSRCPTPNFPKNVRNVSNIFGVWLIFNTSAFRLGNKQKNKCIYLFINDCGIVISYKIRNCADARE